MRKNKAFAAFILILLISAISALSWVPAKTENRLEKTKVIAVRKDEAKLSNTAVFNNYINDIYTEAGLRESNLDPAVFRKAVTGYLNFKQANLLSSAKQILSIVDFNQSSRTKRLWVIDLANKKLLFNTYVAHGQGSGDDMATSFSNIANSHQSSVGFYITDNIYYGKHGISLRLNGMDKGFNSNALNRAIVVHGAEYVSENFINQYGRLGRSFGCPAIPVALTPGIINTIKDKTCLFINSSLPDYTSGFLNQQTASDYYASAASATNAADI